MTLSTSRFQYDPEAEAVWTTKYPDNVDIVFHLYGDVPEDLNVPYVLLSTSLYESFPAVTALKVSADKAEEVRAFIKSFNDECKKMLPDYLRD
jgi:hypothetical protein